LSTTPNLRDLDDVEEFNLLSEKALEREFKDARKQKDLQIVLYFVREVNEQLNTIDGSPGDNNIASKMLSSDPELRKVINEFRDVFRDELPDGLPPERPVDHVIDTGSQAPTNRNAYPLSVAQLEEQTKQIQALLKRGLIRESVSP